MGLELVDTHCHLCDEQFAGRLDNVLSNARQAGVLTIVSVGTCVQSSTQCIALAAKNSGITASVGIHPNHCAEAQEGDWDRIVDLAANDRVVALGETGLDRYWQDTPFPLQQDYFDRHIRLSQDTGLPFIVHMRECEADILAMLTAAHRRGPLIGVMHSFTGTEETARACLDLGLHVSFAGMVTYKKSDELRRVAAVVPNDRILIETDAPYLSPHPHRGQRPNEPALLVHTAECVADVRQIPVLQFAEQTTANARRLFGVGSG